MKKVLLFLPLLALLSCQNKQTLTLSGKIDNPTDDHVLLFNPALDKTDTLTFNKEAGTFTAELPLEKDAFVYLSNGRSAVSLYVEPGNALVINFDAQELKDNNKESLSISGEGSAYSNFLLRLNKIKIEDEMRTLLAHSAPKFDSMVQGNYSEIEQAIATFQTENNPSESFINKIKLMKKLNMIQMYDYFLAYHHRIAPKDTIPVPEEFKELGKDIPLDNQTYFDEIRAYKHFVVNSYEEKIEKQLEDQNITGRSIAFYNKKFDAIQALNVTQKIKDELGNFMLRDYTYLEDSIKDVMKNRYADVIKNEKYIGEFKELISKLDALKPGAVAPTFAYNDKDGNLIKSENLKGKVIYVDVWATWCGPCKGEIPHMKNLEEALHDEEVAFVSVSVDQDKEAWLKMIAEKEMGGYQLHAPKAWESDIIKDYAIKGIPRFILIDQEGKLVNANATRPSNPETKKTILELLKS